MDFPDKRAKLEDSALLRIEENKVAALLLQIGNYKARLQLEEKEVNACYYRL